jgi:hypothetical protein
LIWVSKAHHFVCYNFMCFCTCCITFIMFRSLVLLFESDSHDVASELRFWFNVLHHVWGFVILWFMVVHSDRCKCWHGSAWNHLKKRCWDFIISFFFFNFVILKIWQKISKKFPIILVGKEFFCPKKHYLVSCEIWRPYKNLVWVLVIYILGFLHQGWVTMEKVAINNGDDKECICIK